MMGLVIAIHVIVCALLMVIILIQAGRGGGLVEGFSGMESMFGSKTNTFLTRTTTILAILFFLTSISLALLSARQSRSLMQNVKMPASTQTPAPQVTTKQEPASAQTQTAQKEPVQNPPKPEKTEEAPKTE